MLLGRLASASPAPGGGAAAAWTAAIAAGLVEMGSRHPASGHSDRTSEIGSRAAWLRAQALTLADQDQHSYAPVLEAQRLPDDDPERSKLIADALQDAAVIPLTIAQGAAEIGDLAAETLALCKPALRGDLETSRLLARAARCAAAQLVVINLAHARDDARFAEATRLLEADAN